MGLSESDLENNPVTIVLDSPLTHHVSEIFRDELQRRQIKKTNEYLFFNKHTPGLIGIESDAKTKGLIELLYSPDRECPASIARGVKVFYKQRYCLDDRNQERIILITGAGSCDGGPVTEHLGKVLSTEGATILLTGFMGKGTVGAHLQEFSEHKKNHTVLSFNAFDVGQRNIKVIDIRADIEEIGAFYSGHADQEGLLDFVFGLKVNKNDEEKDTVLFLNHGSESSRKKLRELILEKSTRFSRPRITAVETPSKDLRWYNLDGGHWEENDSILSPVAVRDILREQVEIKKSLIGIQQKLNDLTQALVSLEGSSDL